MAVTLADLDTLFATLGRARVRRLKKQLADLVGPLRLRDEVPLFDVSVLADERDYDRFSDG
jgi:hypothetical protein